MPGVTTFFPDDGDVVPWIAGSASGVAALAVGHPFDTVKVRLQTQPVPPIFAGPVDCLRKTIDCEGVLALYKGITPPLIGKGTTHSLLFAVYEKALHNLDGFYGSQPTSFSQNMLAGAIAGWATVPIVTPIDQIKACLQTQYSSSSTTKFKGPLDCFHRLVASRGVYGGLYRHWFPTAIEMTGMSVYFGVYEASRAHFTRKLDCNSSKGHLDIFSPLVSFVAGGFGGLAFWLTALPADAVKNKLMTQPLDKDPRFSGFVECFSHTLKTQGIAGLYKGMGASLLRTFPVNGATFMTYEGVTRLLKEDAGRIETSRA